MSAVVSVLREDWADPDVPLPSYATAGAAGADVRANLSPEHREKGLRLAPMQRLLVPTGMRVEIPLGFEMQLRPRSGMALKQGLTLLNTPGTIDSDYRGPLGLLVINLGQAGIVINHGDRLAQAIIAPVIQADFVETFSLSDTARGASGFGSTGQG